MPRKRIADKEPAVVTDGAAAAAKAPAKRQTSEAPKARAPRASANAVTHRHKKTATQEIANPAAPVAEDVRTVILAVPAPETLVTETPVPIVAAMPATPAPALVAPTDDEIREQAYLVWESRGYQGSEVENWLIAERMLSERTSR